ncbi:winged helix-turn-helix transcriptional regulator [Salinispora vitiensis]
MLTLIGRGLSNAELAGHLGLSLATVKTHVGRLLTGYLRLGCFASELDPTPCARSPAGGSISTTRSRPTRKVLRTGRGKGTPWRQRRRWHRR